MEGWDAALFLVMIIDNLSITSNAYNNMINFQFYLHLLQAYNIVFWNSWKILIVNTALHT